MVAAMGLLKLDTNLVKVKRVTEAPSLQTTRCHGFQISFRTETSMP